MRRGVGSVVTAIVLAVGVAACANPEYHRSTVERDLERDSGLTSAQAACVARRLEDTVGERRLGARDVPSPAERAYLHSALVFAGVACSGRPFDAAKVQRFLVDKAKVGASEAACLTGSVAQAAGEAQLTSSDALQASRVTAVRNALATATAACTRGGDAELIDALRRNVGLDLDQAKCVARTLQRGDPDVARCTSVSASTTTSTSTSTTLRPSSTPSS